MTRERQAQLAKAREEAAQNPPLEIKDLIIDTSGSRNKKGSQQILMEMRYGR